MMTRKSFFKAYDNNIVAKNYKLYSNDDIISSWNKEIPEHVQNFNSYNEDRSAVIYFALFVEFHLNKTIEILFPDFDKLLDFSKTATSTKINILATFRLYPKQLFEACRCINYIRNEFAHNFSVTNIDQLNQLKGERKKKTIDKLISLTNEYKGDYEYENISDTLRNRYKSLVMNTITAFRIYEPITKRIRIIIETEC